MNDGRPATQLPPPAQTDRGGKRRTVGVCDRATQKPPVGYMTDRQTNKQI